VPEDPRCDWPSGTRLLYYIEGFNLLYMLTISYVLVLHCTCFRRSCIEHCSADTILRYDNEFLYIARFTIQAEAFIILAVNYQKHCFRISGLFLDSVIDRQQRPRQETKLATKRMTLMQWSKSTIFIDTISGRESMFIPIWTLR
jgi:hypothetical protein